VLARHNVGVAVTLESVSIGGARFVGPLSLETAEEIQILFEIDGHLFEVRAEVVRIESRDMVRDRVAVRFVELTPEARELLHGLVEQTLDRANMSCEGEA